MLNLSRSTTKSYLRGGGAILFFCIAHVAHDYVEGDVTLSSLVAVSLAILIQSAVLSLGYEIAERKRWSGKISLLAAACFSAVWGQLIVWLHSPIHAAMPEDERFSFIFAGIGVLGLWFLVCYFPKKLDDAAERVFIAESARVRAELARLRSTLHPHFLLNTLNAVAGLTTSNPRQARQLLSALGDLLRDSLEDSEEMIPLRIEIEWLHRYAEIFEIRYAERITFGWDIAPESMSVMIPKLLLQPLIENAIEHGALRSTVRGTVRVSSSVLKDEVCLTVQDNGPGIDSQADTGVGLRLVRERLLQAFPGATMEVHSLDPGCKVTLMIKGAGYAK